MRALLCFVSFFFAVPAFGLELHLSYWSRPQKCEWKSCLPKTIATSQHTLEEPDLDSVNHLHVQVLEFVVKFSFAKKSDFGGYYSFQTEVIDGEGKTMALCSRYEKLTTMERAPVGACSGVAPEGEQLFGVTILRPPQ